jgi:hypothetical protein
MNLQIRRRLVGGNFMPKTFILLMLIAVGSLLGCYELQRDDVSDHSEFKHVVGSRFEVVSKVDAYGIREYSKAPVEYITLIPPPALRKRCDYCGCQSTLLQTFAEESWLIACTIVGTVALASAP